MAEFVINADVVTEEPRVEVTVSPNRPLGLGRQRFRLIVVDDTGNRSQPDEVTVIVADQDAPTAVLRAPRITGFGRSFDLDGSASQDAGGGRIVQYVWTYLGPDQIG
jgi:hypothetical protein